MESFAGADLHKRVTQLAVLRDGQPPSQFRFPNAVEWRRGDLFLVFESSVFNRARPPLRFSYFSFARS